MSKYLKLNVPSLLAAGNLPALARDCDITYRIFSSNADLPQLKEKAAIRALARHAKMDFRAIPDDALAEPMVAHHAIWNETAEDARALGSFILLMPPDVVFSDGSFAHVGSILRAGKHAIFMTYMRVESETFSKALLARRDRKNDLISVSGRELMDIALRTAHPLMGAYLRDSTQFPVHPEMMFWSIAGEGLACRVLAREMFIYEPSQVRLNYSNLLDSPMDTAAVHVVDDSDDLFAVSLTPLEKDFDWYRWPRKADVDYIGEWWLDYDSWINDLIAGASIRWHTGGVSEDKWRARERAANLFLRRSAAIREGRRLFREARRLKCKTAAGLLAVAVQGGLMPHVARGRGGALVFLPSDDAFEAAGRKTLDHWRRPEGRRDLVRLMRRHYVPSGTLAYASVVDGSGATALPMRAADASKLEIQKTAKALAVSGAGVIDGPVTSGKNVIYVVDRLLAGAGQPGHPSA